MRARWTQTRGPAAEAREVFASPSQSPAHSVLFLVSISSLPLLSLPEAGSFCIHVLATALVTGPVREQLP